MLPGFTFSLAEPACIMGPPQFCAHRASQTKGVTRNTDVNIVYPRFSMEPGNLTDKMQVLREVLKNFRWPQWSIHLGAELSKGTGFMSTNLALPERCS